MHQRMLAVTLLFLSSISVGPTGRIISVHRFATFSPPAGPPTPAESFARENARFPLIFEANRGQADPDVRFLAKAGGYSLRFKEREVEFIIAGTEAVRMRLDGARPHPAVFGFERQPANVNYFVGNDPHQWRTGIPTFAGVTYESVYPGVDLVYYGSNRQVEFDFVVAPGADPSVIGVVFDGIAKSNLDTDGALVMETAVGSLRLNKPIAYQESEGKRRDIAASYVIKTGGLFGFQIGDYDRTAPLVIDPVLSYSTYLGGDDFDLPLAITVDGSGNAYVTGATSSTNFPTAAPTQRSFGGGEGGERGDAFIAKLNPAGTAFVYSTYLGGMDTDAGLAIATDSEGNTYVTGITLSENFPVQNAFQSRSEGYFDAFVVKLDPAGTLIYSTYIGGDDFDRADGIAVDSARNLYITGRSLSGGTFPLKNAYRASPFGAFVAKLDSSGSGLVYSTFLGLPEGWSIAVDSSGSAYVTGDMGLGMFLAKLMPSGSAPNTRSIRDIRFQECGSYRFRGECSGTSGGILVSDVRRDFGSVCSGCRRINAERHRCCQCVVLRSAFDIRTDHTSRCRHGSDRNDFGCGSRSDRRFS